MKRLLSAFLFALLPLVAVGEVRVSEPGQSIRLGEGFRLAVPAYDIDALAYFATAGVTDPTAKRQISNFARGVKALGLWNNMVCWMLRSSQNAGTGTTAYSFGGLGAYNGTLVNGPTWGADGMVTTASTQYILIPQITLPSNVGLLFSVTRPEAFILPSRPFNINGAGKILGTYAPFSDGKVYLDFGNSSAARLSANIGITSGSFFSVYGGSQGGTTETLSINAIQIASGGTSLMAGTYDGVSTIVSPGGAGIQNSTTSFQVIVSGAHATASQIHDLYKSTIGQGLGLP